MRKDAACLAALGAALLFAPAASAGTYDVVSCNGAGAGINHAWSFETFSNASRTPADASNYVVPADSSSCGTATGLDLRAAPVVTKAVKARDGAAWVFHAPPGNVVQSLVIHRAGNARLSAAGANTFWEVIAYAGSAVGTWTQLGTVAGTDYCSGQGVAWPGYCTVGAAYPNPTPATYVPNQAVVGFGIECFGPNQATSCATGGNDNGTIGTNAVFDLLATTVTVADNTPPVMGAGDPTDGWHRPSDILVATGTDGGGLKEMHASIDGTEVASASFACDFHLPSPCSTSPRMAVPLTGLTDGAHAVTVTGTDVAANGGRGDRAVNIDGTPPDINLVPTKGGRTITFSVADALSGVNSGQIEVRANRDMPFTPLATTLKGGKLRATVPKGKQPSDFGIRVSATDNAGNVAAGQQTTMTLNTRLNKHLTKVRKAAATVPYKSDVVITGRLTTVDGVPLGGQPIRVDSTLRQSRATTQLLRTVTTAPSGRFSFRVPPGPSRRLDLTFSGAPDLLHRTRSVTLHVPARSTIHASDTTISGARTVRFNGRLGLLGTRLPSGGKIVVLEAEQRGRWTTVASTRARGAKASWHAVAHFRGNPGTFPVRLRIPREAVFPYDLGHSRAVRVRVF